MERVATIDAEVARTWPPNWGPLEALLPLLLCSGFAWVCTLRRADGLLVEEYRHEATRKRLWLAEGALAFRPSATGDLTRVPLSFAVRCALRGWERFHPTEVEVRALKDLLATLAPIASGGASRAARAAGTKPVAGVPHSAPGPGTGEHPA